MTCARVLNLVLLYCAIPFKPCLEIEYSNISRYFYIQYDDTHFIALRINNSLRLPTYLGVFSTGKSVVIMQVWHAGSVDNKNSQLLHAVVVCFFLKNQRHLCLAQVHENIRASHVLNLT